MTQPVGSYRLRDCASDPPAPDPPAPPAGPAPGGAPGRPTMLQDGSPPLVREAQASVESVPLAIGPDAGPRLTAPLLRSAEAEVLRARVRDANVQRGLDAFFAAMSATYHTPEGDVQVAAAFVMSFHPKNQQKILDTTGKHLASAILRAGLPLSAGVALGAGRGTPEQIQRVTQALIDGGYLSTDTSISLHDRVRQLMFEHAIGIDCAGYVQQAYLRATGTTRASAQFRDMTTEDLSGLSTRGYARVQNLGDVRPGDIAVLHMPPPAPGERASVGHRVIVYEQHWATEREIDVLRLESLCSNLPSFATKGPILVITVDSSWGSIVDHNAVATVGGVRRETWWYNEETGMWAWLNGWPLSIGPGAYDHSLEGFYRSTRSLPTPTRAP